MTVDSGEAVLWDVDGTLVDTAELHFQAWLEVARERQHPFSRSDFVATFGRRNPEIIHELFADRLSAEEIEALGRHKEEKYRQAARRQGVTLLPGVRSLLENLRVAGFLQAVGSSAPRDNLDLILRLTQIESFFTAIVAMEDTERGKPDPQVFELAAVRAGVAPGSCVVIEDAPAGVQAAKAGGMKCIAVRCVAHHDEARLRQAGADLVVDNLEAVSVQTVRDLLRERGMTLPRAAR